MSVRWMGLSVLSLLLAACGGGGGGATQSSQGAPVSPVTNPPPSAGDGESSDPGNGGATGYTLDPSARFNRPAALALGGNGDLFVMDEGNRLIRKVASTGEVTTVPTGFDEAVVPSELGADRQGNLYVQLGSDLAAVTPDGQQNLLYSQPGDWSRRIPSLRDFMVDVQGRWYPITSYTRSGPTWYSTYRYGPGEQKQWYEFMFTPYLSDFQMDRSGNMAAAGYYDGAWTGPGSALFVLYIPASAQLVEQGPTDTVLQPLTVDRSQSYRLEGLGFVHDIAFGLSGNLLIARTYPDPDNPDRHKAGIASMAPDGTVTTVWDGFPDGSTDSRPGLPSYEDADFGLAVADNGDIFISDPYRHAVYRINPSTGQSVLMAGKPGEAGNTD